MIRILRRRHVLFPVLFLVILAASAAQQQANPPVSVAPNSVSASVAANSGPVARLDAVSGVVQIKPADPAEDPYNAAVNAPVWQGEQVRTGGDSQAEIEFPDGSVLRLTPNSTTLVQRLGAATEVVLGDGLFYLELRVSDVGTYSVYAGNSTLIPKQNASFRVRVAAGQPESAVLTGNVLVSQRNSYSVELQAGESLRPDPKDVRRYLLADAVPAKDWDRWNETLSQTALDEADARTSARDSFAGDQGYGWSDLDADGSWYSVPNEGMVWQPTGADANFDPFGYGAWVYGPGGYVWASGYAWGWLPYRCGRWGFYPGFGWGWLPAAACRTYGGGYGGGGGYPVSHPPEGWRAPRPPALLPAHDLRIHHHPTLPLRLAGASVPATRRDADPGGETVTIGSLRLHALAPIARPATPQGGSAVGSALLRDFPVRPGTQEPVLGVQNSGMVAVPGRVADWHAPAVEPTAETSGAASSMPGTLFVAGGAGSVRSGQVAVDRRSPATAVGDSARSAGLLGAPPFGGTGEPPVGGNGAPPLGANGAPPTGASSLAPPARVTAGGWLLPRSPSPAIGETGRVPSAPVPDAGEVNRPVVSDRMNTAQPVPVYRGPLAPAPILPPHVSQPAPVMHSAPPPPPPAPPQMHTAAPPPPPAPASAAPAHK